jgi:NADH:ubiquinone oxidoreductase subunit 2 (subunit N)
MYSFTLCTFLLITWVCIGFTDTGEVVVLKKNIDFCGLIIFSPFIGVSLLLCLSSFIGLPPFMGFVGKLLLISEAAINNYLLISTVLLFTGIAASFYYLKLIKYILTFRYSMTVHLVRLSSLNYMTIVIFNFINIVFVSTFPYLITLLSCIANG